MSEKLLHRGSVKDIYQISEQELLFRFSDRYSIFDWGEMPDAIPQKGDALALMGNKLLHYLTHEGFSTHYLNQGKASNEMCVKAVAVPRDGVEIYQRKPTQILVPLEVIYRFGVPKGSSLLKRYADESAWQMAGFDRAYAEGEDFLEVKLDFTTKLEKMDRLLSEEEARQLSGMDLKEMAELKRLTGELAHKLKGVFERCHMKLWDGKFEFAFGEDRKLMLVDSIGLDEIRLTYEGHPLSKELLRQAYLKTSWYSALSLSKEKEPREFKSYCEKILKETPKSLPREKIMALSILYTSVAHLILNDQGDDQNRMHQRLKQALGSLVGPS